MKWRATLLCLAISFGLIPVNSAQAIYKGTSALGSPYVVKYRTTNSWCSGSLIEPQILVTAAHCIVNGGISVPATDIGVYPPGADTTKSSIVSRGYKIFFPPGYKNDTIKIEPNDIAFVVLDKPVELNMRIKLANFEIAQQLISQGATFTHYGYGRMGLANDYPSIPQQVLARPTTQKKYTSFRGFERTYVDFLADEAGSTCPGDSGGPTIAVLKSEAYLFAVHSGGSSPCHISDADWGSTGTIPGEYQSLYSAAATLIANLKPTDVTNVRVSSSSLTGIVTWDLPKSSPVAPTGYVIKDVSANELCRTTTNSCQVILKPGLNLLTVFALAGNIFSNGVSTEYIVKNATNPDFVGADTYQSQVSIKWSAIRDFGGATQSATYVEIRDEADGSVLCTALSTQSECRFTYLQKGYNLLLNVKSDIGQTESVQIGRFSGILQTSLVDRTVRNVQDINTQLRSYLLSNPGYKAEIAQLQSQVPLLTPNFIFTEEGLTQLLNTRNSVSALVSRIISNPKKATIYCTKGKTTKKVIAINPICPRGYKKK